MHPVIKSMMNNGLGNYIVPGLHSYLIGGKDFGKVRLFAADRNTRDNITPHNHRFSFFCYVLNGKVINTIYEPILYTPDAVQVDNDRALAQWVKSEITQVCGYDGVREFKHSRSTVPAWYRAIVKDYVTGNWYSMDKDQIHSITFAKGTNVLFFEGPEERSFDNMLEPWVNGKVVPTFKVEPWMFERLP